MKEVKRHQFNPGNPDLFLIAWIDDLGNPWVSLECLFGIEWFLPFEDPLHDFVIQTDGLVVPLEWDSGEVSGDTNWYSVMTTDQDRAFEGLLKLGEFHRLERMPSAAELQDREEAGEPNWYLR